MTDVQFDFIKRMAAAYFKLAARDSTFPTGMAMGTPTIKDVLEFLIENKPEKERPEPKEHRRTRTANPNGNAASRTKAEREAIRAKLIEFRDNGGALEDLVYHCTELTVGDLHRAVNGEKFATSWWRDVGHALDMAEVR